MKRTSKSDNASNLRQRIIDLRADRRMRKTTMRSTSGRRQLLTRGERAEILAKTAGHCHICGGHIGAEKWQADHVLAHSGGGQHRLDNYLPAHALCNNYRWDYMPEEFQLILKLGVYTKTQIERGTSLGNHACEAFAAHEGRRMLRRHV